MYGERGSPLDQGGLGDNIEVRLFLDWPHLNVAIEKKKNLTTSVLAILQPTSSKDEGAD